MEKKFPPLLTFTLQGSKPNFYATKTESTKGLSHNLGMLEGRTPKMLVLVICSLPTNADVYLNSFHSCYEFPRIS